MDAVSDGETVVIGGIMEHIERAGVHSGDSSCSLPPRSLDQDVQKEIRRQTTVLARELNVVGLMNVQFAVKGNVVYILEVNPRASRTVPFVSKATGVPLAKVAAKVMAGKKLREIDLLNLSEMRAGEPFGEPFDSAQDRLGSHQVVPAHISVKEAVFPFFNACRVERREGP